MSIFKQIKPNEPVAGLEGYFISMYGQSKVGKTTFIYDLIKKHYNNDLSKALILATEMGYKTLRGVHAMDITGFEDPEVLADNPDDQYLYGFGFIQAIDSLIEERSSIPYRLIIIDTLSALQRYAGKYVAHNRSIKDEEVYENIGDIGWGNGYNLLQEAIYEQIDRLKKAGFGVITISHDKTKTIKPKVGSEWDYTTLNLESKVADIVVREADINMYAQLRTISGAGGTVRSERKLIMRSSGNIECGSRFKTMPDEMEFDAEVFLNEFKKAVNSLYDNDKEAIEAKIKEDEQDAQKKAMKVAKDQEVEKADPKELHDKLTGLLKGSYNDRRKEMAEACLDILGEKNYLNSLDIKKLNQLIGYLEERI